MATIANLVVEVKARTTKLQQGLRKSLKQVDKFTKGAAMKFRKLGMNIKKFAVKSAKSIGKLTAALTVLGTVALVFGIRKMNSLSKEMDQTAKQANALQIAVGSLQKIQFQAALSGLSPGDIRNSMRQMVRGIGDAQRGGLATTKAFKDMGLELDSLVGLKADEQFLKIAQALNKVKDQNIRGSAANVVFGRQWLAIQNLVRSDMEKSGKLFDKIGGGITDEQARQVEEFEDAKTTFGTVFDILLKNVTADVVPMFGNLLNHLTDQITAWGGLGKVGKSIAKGMVGGIQSIITSLASGITKLDMFVRKLDEMAKGVFSVAKKVKGILGGGLELAAQTGSNLGIIGSNILAGGDGKSGIQDTIFKGVKGTQAVKDAVILKMDEQFKIDSPAIQKLDAQLIKNRVSGELASTKVTNAMHKVVEVLGKGATSLELTKAKIPTRGMNEPSRIFRQGLSFSDKPFAGQSAAPVVKVEVAVKAEEGIVVDKVIKSDKFDLIVQKKLEEGTKAAARQVAR